MDNLKLNLQLNWIDYALIPYVAGLFWYGIEEFPYYFFMGISL